MATLRAGGNAAAVLLSWEYAQVKCFIPCAPCSTLLFDISNHCRELGGHTSADPALCWGTSSDAASKAGAVVRCSSSEFAMTASDDAPMSAPAQSMCVVNTIQASTFPGSFMATKTRTGDGRRQSDAGFWQQHAGRQWDANQVVCKSPAQVLLDLAEGRSAQMQRIKHLQVHTSQSLGNLQRYSSHHSTLL